MKFVVLDNIKELKEIFTPYILTALTEKYMETYQRECLDKINEEYKKKKTLVINFVIYGITISHYSSVENSPSISYSFWRHDVADFPKRYKYSSGMNHPNGFKEF